MWGLRAYREAARAPSLLIKLSCRRIFISTINAKSFYFLYSEVHIEIVLKIMRLFKNLSPKNVRIVIIKV